LVHRNTTGCGHCHEFEIGFSQSVWFRPGTIRFKINTATGPPVHNVYTNQNSWNADQWYHIAGVIHPQIGMMLFVDGVKQDTINPNVTNSTTTTYRNTVIGGMEDFTTRHFPGRIDDVRFSSDAVYASNFTPPCPDLPVTPETIGLWHFNTGSGNIAFDASPNSYDGQISGTTWVAEDFCSDTTSSPPNLQLHVEGSIKIEDGSEGDGKVLTSDANGLASWQSIGDVSETNEIQDLNEVLSEGNDAGSSPITNLADPTYAQDAVTKHYLDNLVGDLVANMANELMLNVQQRLNFGETPMHIYNSGIPVDSLYGKTYKGGLIFYLDISDLHPFEGLVVAPSNQNESAAWGCLSINVSIPDSDDGTGPGADIGDGTTNTAGIDADSCSSIGDAAVICADLILNGYDDWLLPSILELGEMYFNLHLNGHGGFSSSNYWSSTERNDLLAWQLRFLDGLVTSTGKDEGKIVQAVRAF
jgi:hypothetical protein